MKIPLADVESEWYNLKRGDIMFTNQELLQMVKEGKSLSEEQLKQLVEAGFISPVESDWTDKAKKMSYSELAHEYGFDDEDGEPIEPN